MKYHLRVLPIKSHRLFQSFDIAVCIEPVLTLNPPAIFAACDLTPLLTLCSRSGDEQDVPRLKKPKTHDAEHRRKSTGRSERRSLVHMDIAKSLNPTALYLDIDDGRPSEERFMQLVSKCFQRSLDSVAEKQPRTFKGLKPCAEEVTNSFESQLREDGEHRAAVEAPVLRPNPKNSQMRRNLQLYQNTRGRLSTEDERWDHAVRDAEAVAAAAADAAARVAAMEDTTEDGPSPTDDDRQNRQDQHDAATQHLETQVKTLEHTVRILRSVDQHMHTFIASQQAGVASKASSSAPDANPTSLIRTITKAAPQE